MVIANFAVYTFVIFCAVFLTAHYAFRSERGARQWHFFAGSAALPAVWFASQAVVSAMHAGDPGWHAATQIKLMLGFFSCMALVIAFLATADSRDSTCLHP